MTTETLRGARPLPRFQQYQPHTVTSRPEGLDWDNHTPTCPTCGVKSGSVAGDACGHCQPVVTQTIRREAAKRATAPRTENNQRQRNRIIVDQYRNGATAAAIALTHGMSAKRVRTIIKNAGVEFRSQPREQQRKGGDPVFAARICELYASGLTQKQVATEAHTSVVVVSRVLRANHVPIRANVIQEKQRVKHENRDRVLALHKKRKLTHAQIAAELNISETTVGRILREQKGQAA